VETRKIKGEKMTYKIIRFYKNYPNKVVIRGLSLEQAQEHCSDPETSSRTCTSKRGMLRTKKFGEWFDGYKEE
jgi:hypothetical protein